MHSRAIPVHLRPPDQWHKGPPLGTCVCFPLAHFSALADMPQPHCPVFAARDDLLSDASIAVHVTGGVTCESPRVLSAMLHIRTDRSDEVERARLLVLAEDPRNACWRNLPVLKGRRANAEDIADMPFENDSSSLGAGPRDVDTARGIVRSATSSRSDVGEYANAFTVRSGYL